MVKSAQLLGMDHDGLKTVYTPVIYLHDHTPLKKPLEWYVKLWGER